MAVSAASTWQKNGRTSPKPLDLQCCNSLAVSGVTCHWFGLGSAREVSTYPRTSLMIEVGSYCCSLVERPLQSSKRKRLCAAALRFLGLGIGVMNLALRRWSMTFCVGCPVSSSSQCFLGYSYGEFRIGWSKNGSAIEHPMGRRVAAKRYVD